jgi:pimeloyl-ACP methyl ester carboxylesterase
MSATFVVTCREVRGNKFGDEPGPTRYLRVPAGADGLEPSHETTAHRWRRGVIAVADGVEDDLTGATGDVLVFVHGYNNTTRSVLSRTRTLASTLKRAGWKGTVIAFDWPSANSTLNYLEDRSDAARTALRLAQDALALMVDAQDPKDGSPPCTLNVHLLGHSTGAYVIMESFAQAEKDGNLFKRSWRIAQVAFIGGDVSRESLRESSEWGRPMFSRIMRLTNYASGFDQALAVSNAKRLGTSPRAGRVGLPADVPRKAVNVDCSRHFLTKDPKASTYEGNFTHSWYIGDPVFALDLAMTLEGEIDREVIPTRERADGTLHLRPGERPAFQKDW